MNERARAALAELAESPSTTGLLTDFDGTLAPIVDDPEASRPLPGSLAALRRLAGRFAVVSVISGRPAAFVAAQLGLAKDPAPISAFGLYGLEEAHAGGEVRLDPDAARWASVVTELAGVARATLPAGVLVEDKALTLGLHWRTAPDAVDAVVDFAQTAADAHGFVLSRGRKAVELLPPSGCDKGAVVTRLVEGLATACYFGDDTGDLPAFRVLSALAARRDRAALRALRIAVASDEAPPALLLEADVVLEGPVEVESFLEELAARTQH